MGMAPAGSSTPRVAADSREGGLDVAILETPRQREKPPGAISWYQALDSVEQALIGNCINTCLSASHCGGDCRPGTWAVRDGVSENHRERHFEISSPFSREKVQVERAVSSYSEPVSARQCGLRYRVEPS